MISTWPVEPTYPPEDALNCDGEDLGGQIVAGSNFKDVPNPFSRVGDSYPAIHGALAG